MTPEPPSAEPRAAPACSVPVTVATRERDMADETRRLQEDPPEGARDVVERELERQEKERRPEAGRKPPQSEAEKPAKQR